jgi:hypothetical protein
MSLSTQMRLQKARQARQEAEAELLAERQIAAERAAAYEASLALHRLNETLEQRAEREEFQERLARIIDCPELSPNWRDLPNYPSGKPHKGGSTS